MSTDLSADRELRALVVNASAAFILQMCLKAASKLCLPLNGAAYTAIRQQNLDTVSTEPVLPELIPSTTAPKLNGHRTPTVTHLLCRDTINAFHETATSKPNLKETLATSIHEFNYDPDNGVTFSSWYQRYEDIFLVDAAALDEFARVRLLMQKLGAAEHAQHCNYILPQKSRDFILKDTVSKLCSIFGERTSAFNIRYNCLKISRHATKDIVTYAGRVNRECERFQLKQISDSQFKALIFVAGLTSSEDADIRTCLLAKLDSCTDFSVQDLTAEYLRLVNLKHDSQMLQSTSSPTDIASVDRRPVPYSTTAALEAELDRLDAIGVLSKVNYSSWAAPVVTIKNANGSIRLCGDFSTGLNKALQTHHCPLPVPEDLFTPLNGGKIFSKINFSDAYLQVEVDDSCKGLLTMNTPRRLYRYSRPPFSFKCAPAIFQQIMDTMLSGLAFAVSYMDDIIIASPSPDEYKTHLEQVFNRIHEYGFTLRKQKCEFSCLKSNIWDLSSIAMVVVRTPLKFPRLKTSLPQLIDFVPNMHQPRAPLNNLLRKDTKWVWSHECQSAFDSLKRILSSDLLLTHYDPNLPIIVAADASDYGIGAVILHEFPEGHQKAISHTSRTLLPAERNYSQIDLEGVALIFAGKKFHKMLYGRRFTLCTDHKPLLSILATPQGIPVHTVNRLQRWTTLPIGYDFVLKYVQTERFGHADVLSRLNAHKSINHPSEDVVISSVEVDADVKYVL
ncbi:uncharacterized protein DEA37_0005046 [Paragonimus westermani]|uniref:Reverse transcriptase domain-containing protein n=1 Tax=Paragonimus westermani TaxID=34504 RepID=A0A5J4NQQ0_9TREM|nr:uncharacterized protein DEA37_0005046 [Paragonimus westermani]